MAKTMLERAKDAANFKVLVPWTRYKKDGQFKDYAAREKDRVHVQFDNPVTGICSIVACKRVFSAGNFDRWDVPPELVHHVIDCPDCLGWYLRFISAKRTKAQWFTGVEEVDEI